MNVRYAAKQLERYLRHHIWRRKALAGRADQDPLIKELKSTRESIELGKSRDQAELTALRDEVARVRIQFTRGMSALLRAHKRDARHFGAETAIARLATGTPVRQPPGMSSRELWAGRIALPGDASRSLADEAFGANDLNRGARSSAPFIGTRNRGVLRRQPVADISIRRPGHRHRH